MRREGGVCAWMGWLPDKQFTKSMCECVGKACYSRPVPPTIHPLPFLSFCLPPALHPVTSPPIHPVTSPRRGHSQDHPRTGGSCHVSGGRTVGDSDEKLFFLDRSAVQQRWVWLPGRQEADGRTRLSCVGMRRGDEMRVGVRPLRGTVARDFSMTRRRSSFTRSVDSTTEEVRRRCRYAGAVARERRYWWCEHGA